MYTKIIFFTLFGVAMAQHAPVDDGDDGSYDPQKYEVPYHNEVSSGPQQRPSYQPQYRAPQPQYQSQPQYQPQPQYQSQPAFRPQSRPTTDYKNAAILSESRHLSGDGSFGAAYTQEDGVEFKEESLPDGSRRGTYSYVDPTGQRRTVSYTAGKNGFQATGAHLPVAPAPAAAAPQPEYRAPQYSQPQPQYSQPQPQYSQSQYRQPQSQYRPQSDAAPASPAGGYTITANY